MNPDTCVLQHTSLCAALFCSSVVMAVGVDNPNVTQGPVRVSIASLRAQFADDTFDGGDAFQEALADYLPAPGTAVGQGCGRAWRVGDIVSASVDHPSGLECVMTGSLGRLVSSAEGGELLVSWFDVHCGHDGNGNAVTPLTANDGNGRWYVDCSEVVFVAAGKPGKSANANFDSFEQNERVLDYYDGGEGSEGSGPGPDWGTVFTDNVRALNEFNGDGEPDQGIIYSKFQDKSTVTFEVPIEALSFAYTSTVAINLSFYEGPAGTGKLIGSAEAPANNDAAPYHNWSNFSVSWGGEAHSIVISAPNNRWGADQVMYSLIPPCTAGDCNENDICDSDELKKFPERDCDGDGVIDTCQIDNNPKLDCDGDGVIDTCQIDADPSADCNDNGIVDTCELEGNDCDGNGTLDTCDLASGATDCNSDGVLDACQMDGNDCNGNGALDSCDLQTGAATDCNGNNIPDSCDIASGTSADVDADGIPDSCETDCNGNSIPDDHEVATGMTPDCNSNGIPDSCDISSGASVDCDANGVPDSCELIDCNGNGIMDSCDIASGFSADCNANGVPDSCDLTSGTAQDCNGNNIPDSCDIGDGTAADCNMNGIPDSCDIDNGAPDCQPNGIPDECEDDPEGDGIPNECEPREGIVMTGPNPTGCYAVGTDLYYDVFVYNPQIVLVAGQFSVNFSSTLELIEVLPGDAPFTSIPLSLPNNAAGNVFFIASIEGGGNGTLADSRVARLHFRAASDDCNPSDTQVQFNPAYAPLLIANGQGTGYSLPYTNPMSIRIDGTAPSLDGVPASFEVPADAGAGCFANRTLEAPTASDNCGSVSLDWVRSDGAELNAAWPCGTTTVTWTATDGCGHTTSAETSVTVHSYHLLHLAVEYAGSGYEGSMTRCIDFNLGSHEFSEVLTFVAGLASADVQLPIGDYNCASADDRLHSLISQASVTIQGNDYALAVAGDNALVNGDLTDDNNIDVVDWGVYVVRAGQEAAVDTDCETAAFHACFNGDGAVSSDDGQFILDNILQGGAAGCTPTDSAPAATTSLTVRELERIIGKDAWKADLNRDGIVDLRDVSMAQGTSDRTAR